ncbi:glycogen synthase GlgA [Novispirillum sp. DQ9]|uniref:glycogen synthase GlgA n=1 Tax=Novispirillum sp. DQ9 TaxID=3398612 RepID=UPI003C79E1C4
MRVLVVASEAYPLIKTGGLADVAGALPAALRRRGVDARILVPAYPGVMAKAADVGAVHALGDVLGLGPSRLVEARMPDSGVPVWLLDCPSLYDRPGGPYQRPDGAEHADNFARFALLSRVAALIGAGEAMAGWAADIVHASDWQTGLVPAYLKLSGRSVPRTVFTIHNLHFAGLFGRDILDIVHLPQHAFSIHGLEFNGLVSTLKAGLYYSDRLTTVSPTYAWEITTPEGGRGLDGLLSGRARAGHFTGILNGVDYDLWDPRHDGDLAMPYGPDTVAEGKAACKAALQREMGLDVRPEAPMLGLVSRFSDQKGIDLVAAAAHHMVDAGAQITVLGSGDWALEQQFLQLARRYPGHIAVETAYDEPLAHRIQAASDIFLVPSRFEPCGLTQLYALRYGALPLVRRTGGLADTVRDMSDEWSGTGFLFDSPTAEGLLSAFYRALGFYHRPEALHYARQRAMAQDFGWHRAADAYVDLYEQTLRG